MFLKVAKVRVNWGLDSDISKRHKAALRQANACLARRLANATRKLKEAYGAGAMRSKKNGATTRCGFIKDDGLRCSRRVGSGLGICFQHFSI